MSFLIDTNVISEFRKGDRCDAHVASWFASIKDEQIYLSVLTLGEIRRARKSCGDGIRVAQTFSTAGWSMSNALSSAAFCRSIAMSHESGGA